MNAHICIYIYIICDIFILLIIREESFVHWRERERDYMHNF